MAYDDQPYSIKGNSVTDQAEASTANRGASTLQMRILIELQVISLLLHDANRSNEDLVRLRQDVANSIS